MPSKVDGIKLQGLQDRRRKLTDAQKEQIRQMYATGLYSQHTLAEMFKCSKSLIQLIVNPKRAETVKNRIKEHWKEYQQPKTERNAAVRNLRKYKKELYNKGELKEESKWKN